ncbi:hypothetical protein CO659_06290 [Rhizobium sp. S9]|nr:hypothetical protein CO659_06290 [Rhizobium sp. S9]
MPASAIISRILSRLQQAGDVNIRRLFVERALFRLSRPDMITICWSLRTHDSHRQKQIGCLSGTRFDFGAQNMHIFRPSQDGRDMLPEMSNVRTRTRLP